MRILIVEDEVHLALALLEIFKKNNFAADAVYDGQSGLDYALSGAYDVIILDIMLPKLNGLNVLSEIRAAKITSHVLLLTAKDQVSDKIKGLDGGADDYLTKPFSTEELLARIRALGRRKGELSEDNLTFGDITLDTKTCNLSGNKSCTSLGFKEFLIMELLMVNKNQIITKEQIIEKVWGFDGDAEYNNVEVYISFLRKKLSFVSMNVQIKTQRGLGYCLEKS